MKKVKKMNKVETLIPEKYKQPRTLGEKFAGIYRNNLNNGALDWAEALYGNAEKEIKIVSGRFSSKFYNNERILKALRGASKYAKIELICGPEVDENSVGIKKLCDNGKVRIWKTKEWPRFHFAVIDRKYIRYEQPHMPGYTGSTKVTVQVRPPGELVEKLLDEFDRLKKDSTETCELHQQRQNNKSKTD